MFRYLAVLAFAALMHWLVGLGRRDLSRKARAGVIPGTVTAVTRSSGSAFGEPTSWHTVTVGYVDDSGRQQVVTQDAPGSGLWKPEVGASVHLYRAAVRPGRVYQDRLGDRGGELIVECEEQMIRLLQRIVYAIAAGVLVWVVVDLVRHLG